MKEDRIVIRISEKEKALWASAAEERGMTLSEFVRFVVNVKIDSRIDAVNNQEKMAQN